MRGLITAFIFLCGTAWACPEGEPAPPEVTLRWATDDPPASAWIISPSEAELPLGRQLVPEKSDPDGPKVTVRDPGEVAEVSPPVTIDIAFQADGGAAVDFNSLKVTYLKLFGIDITARLRPYLTADGIHAANAPLAPGNHSIEISIDDTAGRRTVERFSFTVQRQ